MAWDSSFLITADPDQVATMRLVVHCDPDFPLPLALVECAADLPIDVRVKRTEVQRPDLSTYEIAFTGKCVDLSMLDVNINEWTNRVKGVRRDTREEPHGGPTETSEEGDSGYPV